jgi:methylthioribose-1-phosphate isomerase
VADIQRAVLVEAQQLADDDVAINKRLSGYGAELVKPKANILHHCNTGSVGSSLCGDATLTNAMLHLCCVVLCDRRLATVDYGTALGVIYTCHEQGKQIHVWVDETRPRLQGARLTAWELMRAGACVSNSYICLHSILSTQLTLCLFVVRCIVLQVWTCIWCATAPPVC